MALSEIKLDKTRQYTFQIIEIEDADKTFKSQTGMRKKYIVRFANGYAAEYCPLVDVGPSPLMVTGQPLTFRIAYQKSFGDEIEPADIQEKDMPVRRHGAASENPLLIPSGKIVNVHGNPSTVALAMAKDIYVAIIHNRTEDFQDFGISDMFADADLIKTWLIRSMKEEDPE